MDVCFNGDFASLDPELLQVSEVYPSAVKSNPGVAEELLDKWLSLPETNSLMKSLLNNIKAGGPLNISGTPFSGNASATNSLPSMFPAGSTPPLSPRSSSEFKLVTREICKLPSFLSTALFRKIDVDCTGIVTRDAFVNFWINGNILTKDIGTQIYTVLKQPDLKYLVQDDFKPVLQELLATHPGLEF